MPLPIISALLELVTTMVDALRPDVLPPDDEGDGDGVSQDEAAEDELAGEDLVEDEVVGGEEREAFAFTASPPEGLVRYDPYRHYLAEIRRHPLLTAAEEAELFRQYREEGSRLAALTLVLSHLGLVVKIANKYRWVGLPIMDLIQEGNVGLMHAVRKFDPTKGARLATYGTYWIRALIIKYLVDNWHLVKTVTKQSHRRLLPKLLRARQRLEVLGEFASPKLLAAHLQEKESDVREAQEILNLREFSLETPLSAESGQSLADQISSEGEWVDEEVVEEDFRAKLRYKIGQFREELDERDQVILDHRLLGDPPETLQAIGDRLGITREAVRLREKSLQKRLREFLRQRFPEAEEEARSGR